MDAAELLANINQRHGTSLVLAGRYGSGEQGAFKIVDEADRAHDIQISILIVTAGARLSTLCR